MTRTAIDPQHDLPHTPDPARERWRESYYFQFFDFNLGIGMYCGPGYRPSKGYSGSPCVVWGFDIPTLVTNEFGRYDRHDAVHPVGPLSWEPVEPLREWRLRFDGPMNIGGTDPAIPVEVVCAAGRDGQPTVAVEYNLRFVRDKPAYIYREDPRWDGLFDAHIDEVLHVTGTMRIDGREYEIDGRGSKDHSWGVRDWSLPQGWRWIDMLFEEGPELTLWRTTFDGRTWLMDGAIYTHDQADAITHYAERVRFLPRAEADRPGTWDFEIRSARHEIRGVAETQVVVPLVFGIRGDDGEKLLMWNDRTVFRAETADGRVGVGSAEFQFRVPADGSRGRPLVAPEEPS